MNRLKFWRSERQLSQFELAAGANVPRFVVQLCEQGIRLPTQSQQQDIAATLGVPAHVLFPIEGSSDE